MFDSICLFDAKITPGRSLASDPRALSKLKSADFALFASYWWPTAGLERLTIAVYLVIWLFLWDDEIDNSGGSLSDSFNDSQTYRARTTEFVEQCLGLKDHGLISHELHPYISSFEPIGKALGAAFTPAQAEKFMKEMVIFMDASEVEQRERLDGNVMDLDHYWEVRLGTSAVGVCSAIIDYTNESTVPETIADSPQMEVIWHETNVIVSIVNDVLSLKKELRKDAIDSLIPLTVAAGTPVQDAINQSTDQLRESISRFDRAANSLIEDQNRHRSPPAGLVEYVLSWYYWYSASAPPQSTSKGASDGDAVEAFLTTSRQNCTGNLAWSLVTPRYGLGASPHDVDGAILVDL